MAVDKNSVLLKSNEKAVDINAVLLGNNQKAVDLDAVVLEDNQIAISRDLLASEFTTDIDLTNLRIVDADAVLVDPTQKAVDLDAVVLEDDQIAIPSDLLASEFVTDIDFANLRIVDADALILGPDQKAVNIDDVVLQPDQKAVPDDAVILEPDQKAVDINANVSLENQVASDVANDPVLLDGFKLVPDDAIILDPDQRAVNNDAEILQPNQKAVPIDTPEVPVETSAGKYKQPPSPTQRVSSGVDAAGDSDIAALKLGDDSPGIGDGSGDGEGAGSSNSSGSGVGVSMNEQATQFPEGEGDGDSDFEEQRGQGAPGQGDGEGGDAALGDDQSPSTQRKRGLMLQPIVESASVDEETKSSSKLLKNLSEGSVMGTNLLDALTLGGGILYALYAPQAVKPIKRTFGSLLGRLTGRSSASISERRVGTVFAMKLPDGTQRLIAAKVSTQSIDIIAQQDMPPGMSITQAGNQEQVDFNFNQLLSKISNESFDLVLVGPRLRNQSSLVSKISSESQILETSSIEQKLKSCSQDDVNRLQQWLDRPSSTPPESNPVKDLLAARQSDYSKILITQQASMASLVELSVALSWKD